MDSNFSYQPIPKSRLATFDVYSVALSMHHVPAFLELDVTKAREKIRVLRRRAKKMSFNAFLIKQIAQAVKEHPEAASFLSSKRKLIIFDDVNVSFMIEKSIHNKKVPMPYVIIKANEKSIEEICNEIENAKNAEMNLNEVVVGKKTDPFEKLYYHLPSFMRKFVWRIMLKQPKMIYRKMGNVSITSLGMMGIINGWFLHKSVHPVSFGIGSIIKKPVVIGNSIQVRDILNLTVLLNHDVIDGAQMARFVKRLKVLIENAEEIG